jgi:hypothetical protein
MDRVGHVDADTVVVDFYEDGGPGVVEGYATCGELLVGEEVAIVAAVEDQVRHETAASVNLAKFSNYRINSSCGKVVCEVGWVRLCEKDKCILEVRASLDRR